MTRIVRSKVPLGPNGEKDPNDYDKAGLAPHLRGLLDAQFADELAKSRPPETESSRIWVPPERKLAVPRSSEPDYSALTLRPYTWEEMPSLHLHPPCIVENYLYADVATLFAAGSTGKTTLSIYEAIHIALGRPLYGLEVKRPGTTVFVTAEDPWDIIGARMRELMNGLGLSESEQKHVISRVVTLDVAGTGMRLVRSVNGNLELTGSADRLIELFSNNPPVNVNFDPTISFGADESRVNDNEDRLIHAARRIVRELECGVRYTHHTGKGREGMTGQYVGRGGSALSDGARMVHVLVQAKELEKTALPLGFDGDNAVALARAKLSYAPRGQPLIFLRPKGSAD